LQTLTVIYRYHTNQDVKLIQIPVPDDLKLPAMRWVHQRYDLPCALDVSLAIEQEFIHIKDKLEFLQGKQVAVGVGSRGIANLANIVREVVKKLKDAGAEPFVTPAMGSHGGATAEGQIMVLKTRGITEDTVEAPIKATMEVINLGEIDGIPLFIDRLAYGVFIYFALEFTKGFTHPPSYFFINSKLLIKTLILCFFICHRPHLLSGK